MLKHCMAHFSLPLRFRQPFFFWFQNTLVIIHTFHPSYGFFLFFEYLNVQNMHRARFKRFRGVFYLAPFGLCISGNLPSSLE